jgi:hypothetical protein
MQDVVVVSLEVCKILRGGDNSTDDFGKKQSPFFGSRFFGSFRYRLSIV